MMCPRCQAQNREDVWFCTKCGVPVALTRPSCGPGSGYARRA